MFEDIVFLIYYLILIHTFWKRCAPTVLGLLLLISSLIWLAHFRMSAHRRTVIYVNVPRNNYGMFMTVGFFIRHVLLAFSDD